MTKITFDQISNYLNAGAPLDDVLSMIEMLQAYKEEIIAGIEDWTGLIPEVPDDRFLPGYNWGGANSQEDLRAIVTWLLKQGYAIRFPTVEYSAEGCDRYKWELVKDEQVGSLQWVATEHSYVFFVQGLPKPQPSPNLSQPIPECLTWV